jgi:hypothetical protein
MDEAIAHFEEAIEPTRTTRTTTSARPTLLKPARRRRAEFEKALACPDTSPFDPTTSAGAAAHGEDPVTAFAYGGGRYRAGRGARRSSPARRRARQRRELGRLAIGELLARTGFDPARVDEVILGNCGTPADAANIARVAALEAGIPRSVPAFTVHRNCASGIESIAEAAGRIAGGAARAVIAGGTESMSNYWLMMGP